MFLKGNQWLKSLQCLKGTLEANCSGLDIVRSAACAMIVRMRL
jgi:hypothetical protein